MRENLSKILTVVTTLLLSISIYGQTESSNGIDSTQLAWNLVIALIVIVFTAASAALPVAAARQWQSSWSVAAKIPLFLLAVWISIIIFSKFQSADSHRLWPFELFAWAMFNMVYMVTVMTIKRIIQKGDENASQSE